MLRVLVVDDSPLFAEAVAGVVNSGEGMTCVGVAADGREAVELTEKLRPDVISMDIQMPVMDGLEAIEQIMANHPTPIVVMTADPRGYSGELNFEALRRGALDLIHKPSHFPSSEAEAEMFRERLDFLARIPVVRHVAGRIHRSRGPELDERTAPEPAKIVGIVASTGGPAALASVLEQLPPDYGAGIVVVQHMSPGFIGGLVSWLDRSCALDVRLAKDGERVEAGTVLFAPDDRHLRLTLHGRCRLVDRPPVGGHRPSGNLLLESLASQRHRAIGLVLTGMGDDGVEGLAALRDAGGTTICQDEATSVVYGMPRAAWESGAASKQLSLGRIPPALIRHGGRKKG